ncbi:MAG: hypothetical protein IIX50_04945 [Bacteroidaceae bacterium]|nr:hypothetical protein [Bacteroidaceae bacterium]
MPRLNQVTKELNIGYHTAADFVRTRFGMVVGPNDKITEEQYAALAEEFHRDKVLHDIAEKRFPPRKKLTPREQPKKDVYTEEELSILQGAESMPKSYKDLGYKSASAMKKKKALMKEKWLRKNRKKLGIDPKMVGFVRIVSVPFGGMNKK